MIGRDEFPEFAYFKRLGVHVQSDQVRLAHPDPEYVETALAALGEACRQLDVPEASIVFVDTVVPPPATGLRYGFKGSFTTDYPDDHLDLRELDDPGRAPGHGSPRGSPPRVCPHAHRRGVGGSLRTVGGLRAGVRARGLPGPCYPALTAARLGVDPAIAVAIDEVGMVFRYSGAPRAPRSARTSRAHRESCPRTSHARTPRTRRPRSCRPSRTPG